MVDLFKTRVIPLFSRTYQKWQADDGPDLAAALSYYALFALFPIILVVLSIVGYLLGPDSGAQAEVLTLAARSLPPVAYGVLESTLNQLSASSTGAGIIGFVTLLFTATRLFDALDRAFYRIWSVPRPDLSGESFWMRTFITLKDKGVSIALVLGCGLLVIVSSLAGLLIDVLIALAAELSSMLGGVELPERGLLQGLRLGTSFVILAVVLSMLYRVLPSTRVAWRDVWLGALLTTLALLLLQWVAGLSVVSIGGSYQSYGIIGGVMVLMLWIYLAGQIFFLGGEFTYVYAQLFGSRRPASGLPHEVVEVEEGGEAAAGAAAASPPPVSPRAPEQRTAAAAAVGMLVGVAGVLALLLGVAIAGVWRTVGALSRLVRRG